MGKEEEMVCCQRCQFFDTCVEKWLKAEKHELSHCCEKCQNYEECMESKNE